MGVLANSVQNIDSMGANSFKTAAPEMKSLTLNASSNLHFGSKRFPVFSECTDVVVGIR